MIAMLDIAFFARVGLNVLFTASQIEESPQKAHEEWSYNSLDDEDIPKVDWLKRVRNIRELSRKLDGKEYPLMDVTFALSQIELAIRVLPQPNASVKALSAGFLCAAKITQSVLQFKVADGLLEGLGDIETHNHKPTLNSTRLNLTTLIVKVIW